MSSEGDEVAPVGYKFLLAPRKESEIQRAPGLLFQKMRFDNLGFHLDRGDLIGRAILGSETIYELGKNGIVPLSIKYVASKAGRSAILRGRKRNSRLLIEDPAIRAVASTPEVGLARQSPIPDDVEPKVMVPSFTPERDVSGSSGPITQMIDIFREKGRDPNYSKIQSVRWREIMKGAGINFTDRQYKSAEDVANERGYFAKLTGAPTKEKQLGSKRS